MDKNIKINILENEIRMCKNAIPDFRARIEGERKRNRDWSVTAIRGYEHSIDKCTYLIEVYKQALKELKENKNG